MNKIAIRLSVATLLLLTLAATLPIANAQGDATAIEYGQTIRGEITDTTFEVAYKFKGEAQDVIVAKITREGSGAVTLQPALVLLDSKNKVIADSLRSGDGLVAFQLPTAADYTLIATRRDGRVGKTIGKYILTLVKPEKLIADEPATGKASYTAQTGEVQEGFHLVEAEGPFSIAYEKQSGKFVPTVSLNLMERNTLVSVGALTGRGLTNGSIGIDAKPGLYIVRVNRGFLDSAEGDAEYTLTLTVKKKSQA